jgi:hypothetical protein
VSGGSASTATSPRPVTAHKGRPAAPGAAAGPGEGAAATTARASQ